MCHFHNDVEIEPETCKLGKMSLVSSGNLVQNAHLVKALCVVAKTHLLISKAATSDELPKVCDASLKSTFGKYSSTSWEFLLELEVALENVFGNFHFGLNRNLRHQ